MSHTGQKSNFAWSLSRRESFGYVSLCLIYSMNLAQKKATSFPMFSRKIHEDPRGALLLFDMETETMQSSVPFAFKNVYLNKNNSIL